MGSYRIFLTEKARGQLTELRDYIANTLNEKNTAEKYIDVLSDAVFSLDEMPLRFKLVDIEPHRSRGYRRMLVKNFYIYYSVDVENSTVVVHAVIYARRNQESALP